MTHRDLIEIITSSLIGFIIGYVSCLLGHKAAIREVLTLKWIGDGRRFFGIMILLLLVASGLMYWQSNAARSRLADCVAEQAARTNESIAARGMANQDTNKAQLAGDQAQRVFLKTIYEPGVTLQQREAAYQQYLTALDKVDAALTNLTATQQAHPLVPDGCT